MNKKKKEEEIKQTNLNEPDIGLTYTEELVYDNQALGQLISKIKYYHPNIGDMLTEAELELVKKYAKG
jgi:hypothetical protein